MAYVVRHDDGEASMAAPASDNFRSFLVSGDDPSLMAPPPNSFSFVRRNLYSEIRK